MDKLDKRAKEGVFLILLLFVFDYFTKLYISSHIQLNSGVEVIKGFFNIVHVRNAGVAFGIFAHLPERVRLVALGGVSLVVFVIALYLIVASRDRSFLFILSLSFLSGGDLGNMYDRLFKGYVVDFLDFHIGRYHYPAFNLADTFITVGIVLLLVYKLLSTHSSKSESSL